MRTQSNNILYKGTINKRFQKWHAIRGPQGFPITFNNDILCILFAILIYQHNNNIITKKIICTVLSHLPRIVGRNEIISILKYYVYKQSLKGKILYRFMFPPWVCAKLKPSKTKTIIIKYFTTLSPRWRNCSRKQTWGT